MRINVPWYLSPAVLWRFFDEVDQSGDPDACHMWLGSIDPSTGYGQVNWKVLGGKQRTHVVAWCLRNGRLVPKDPATGRRLDIDHLCHNRDTSCLGGKTCKHRPCCNGRHLEVKQSLANRRAADEPRKRGAFREFFDACGHPMNEENTYTIERQAHRGSGKTRVTEHRCRICTRTKQCKHPEGCVNPRHDHT